MIVRLVALTACCLAATVVLVGQQSTVFRSRTDSVSVNAMVSSGGRPVRGLQSADFRLLDNGVPQAIDDAAVSSVAVDVSLFLDTSPSFVGRLPDLRRDVERIASLLSATDRLRVLSLADEIEEVVHWQLGPGQPNLDRLRLARMSSVYDGIAAALLHQPPPDRRHLVVAITDGVDSNSAVNSERLVDLSAGVEGALHLVLLPPQPAGRGNGPSAAVLRGPDSAGVDRLAAIAERTGGSVHVADGSGMVRAFSRVLDDFRLGYVLRYEPKGVVAAGWHTLAVSVPSVPNAKIRARRGYIGSGEGSRPSPSR